MTWGHMIWIFFPIPVFCLILLSMPSYRRIERVGTKLVGNIFFTRISVGPLYIRLVYVFIGASLLIFGVACRSIQMGFGSAHVPCSGWVFDCCDVLLSLCLKFLIISIYAYTLHYIWIIRTSCPFHTGETMWYRRASRYRAERNFWLSLFTLVLWLLVYNIYALKEKIIKLRGDLETISDISTERDKPKNANDKKRD